MAWPIPDPWPLGPIPSQMRASLHEMQQLQQRAAANVSELRQEKAGLQEELRRRTVAVEASQSRVRALHTVL